jgi:hypothetical protein
MTTGPDDDRRQSSEPTFADVMSGFSVDSARPGKRRWWSRRRGEAVEVGEPEAQPPAPPIPPAPTGPGPGAGSVDLHPYDVDAVGGRGTTAAAVRPYAWTRGRTKPGLDLAIEALVSTNQRGRDQMSLLQVEHRAVAELCAQTRSVAEVAALLSLPLGVARVLLGDMAGLGVVTVHQTASSAGTAPDLALMERVLSGLRRL